REHVLFWISTHVIRIPRYDCRGKTRSPFASLHAGGKAAVMGVACRFFTILNDNPSVPTTNSDGGKDFGVATAATSKAENTLSSRSMTRRSAFRSRVPLRNAVLDSGTSQMESSWS